MSLLRAKLGDPTPCGRLAKPPLRRRVEDMYLLTEKP